jgi:hypothetical protein
LVSALDLIHSLRLKTFLSNKRNNTDWLGFDDGTRDLPQGFPKTPQEYRALGGTNAGVDQQIELSRLFNNDVYAEKKSTALPTQTYSLTWSNVARWKNGGTLVPYFHCSIAAVC